MRTMSDAEGSLGLYVHVPFCERKCAYCDFYSLENHDGVDAFLAALEREVALYADPVRPAAARTVYLGGGTPSILSIDQLRRVLRLLQSRFRVDPTAEVTIEVNPGTVDRVALEAYRSLGFNRLSIGVQSFDPAALEFLGRIHSADDARRCIADARDAGFGNLSIDLIYSVPGQRDDRWYATLAEACRLRPDHISAYSLIVEEQTPLFTSVKEGRVTPNDDGHEAALYDGTMAFLGKEGYDHYEVSNYCLPGKKSRHNSAYWEHAPYLGFGPSAHSYRSPRDGAPASRWSNLRSLGGWSSRLKTGERPLEKEETLTALELFEEGIFLGLRSNGLDPARVERLSGLQFSPRQRETMDALMTAGLAIREGDRLRLTPAGFMICDEVCARLLVP